MSDNPSMAYSSFAGKSMPMNEKLPEFAMIGVYEKPSVNELKFVRITSKQFKNKYSVILFMDNKASELELKEWTSFSDSIGDFKKLNVRIFGVCTDSHVAVRSFMTEHHLQNIKFPIISDRTGDLSRSFGVLKITKDPSGGVNFDAARALAILNDKMELVYLSLKNELTASDPEEIMNVIKAIKRTSDSTSIHQSSKADTKNTVSDQK